MVEGSLVMVVCLGAAGGVVVSAARAARGPHVVEHVADQQVRHVVFPHILVTHVHVQEHHIAVLAVRHGWLEGHLI